jgi:hypothetical protein
VIAVRIEVDARPELAGRGGAKRAEPSGALASTWNGRGGCNRSSAVACATRIPRWLAKTMVTRPGCSAKARVITTIRKSYTS